MSSALAVDAFAPLAPHNNEPSAAAGLDASDPCPILPVPDEAVRATQRALRVDGPGTTALEQVVPVVPPSRAETVRRQVI